MDETYHSTHGAVTESDYVFIGKGLKHCALGKNDISILEIGFGTGLNVLLTYKAALELGVQVTLVSLEPHPIPDHVITQLNYPSLVDGEWDAVWLTIHMAEWNNEAYLGDQQQLKLTKQMITLELFDAASSSFDLIFFDAFAPSKQPEVWSKANLTKCYNILTDGGVLVTYCSQGQFRRDLEESGFDVQKLPGPPGKREMVRAVKQPPIS